MSLGIAAKVDGHVTHEGTLTLDAFASVGSSSQEPVTGVFPLVFTVSIPQTLTPPVSLAPATVLPVFGQANLMPGHYSDLILQGSNKVFLTGGDYYFNNITMTGTFADLNLDLNGGPIRIFVNGDVAFNQLSTFVNGLAQANADPALAANVSLEAHGNIVLSRQFFGGVFAPKGDVTLRSLTDVVGAVVAGDEVIAESAANVSYVRNIYLTAIPEPSAALLACVAVFGIVANCIRLRRTGTIAP